MVTTAAAVSSVSLLACGGSTKTDPGTGGTAGTSSSGGGAGTSPDAGANCPPTVPGSSPPCSQGQSCSYDVNCQSGVQSFEYVCNQHSTWEVTAKSCDKPYDSCPGTELYCNGNDGWFYPQGSNPPYPCPESRPSAGVPCQINFNGTWEHCGYPCDSSPTAKWTVSTCAYDSTSLSGRSWQSDGACD